MWLPHKSKRINKTYNLAGHSALIVTTSQATLDTVDEVSGALLKKGKSTGVYASEMTEPYYTFLDAGMTVEVASINGGEIPIDGLSLMPLVRTEDDLRYLKDPVLSDKVKHSKPISACDFADFDVIFLAGGWGAAYDLAQSEVLANKISEAYAAKTILGAVCHGPLGLVGAKKEDGTDLLQGVKATGVTNRQIKQLFVGKTPKHPETELRRVNATYSSKSGLIDMLNSHVVVDNEHLIVTGQNQKGAIEAAHRVLELLEKKVQGESTID